MMTGLQGIVQLASLFDGLQLVSSFYKRRLQLAIIESTGCGRAHGAIYQDGSAAGAGKILKSKTTIQRQQLVTAGVRLRYRKQEDCRDGPQHEKKPTHHVPP